MISDFLVFEIRKNLNVLVTPKIFLKSRFHCSIAFFIFKTMEYTFPVSHQWHVRTYIVPYTAKDCFYPISSPLSCHNLACQKGMKQQEQRHSNMRLHPSNLRGGRTPDLPLCSLYEFCFRGSSHTFDVRPMETKGLVQSKYTTRYYKQCQKTQTDLVFALKIIATGVRPV